MKRKIAAVTCFATSLILPGILLGQSTFTGPGTTWEDASNWDAGVPSQVNANIGDGFTVGLSSSQEVGELDLVGDQSFGTGTLNHTAGALTHTGGWMKVGATAGNDATYNMSGSAVTNLSGAIYLAHNGATGTLDMSGSSMLTGGFNAGLNADSNVTVNISDSANLAATDFNLGNGNLNQTGGSVSASAWLAIGKDGGSGVYNISGGSVASTADYFSVGESTSGQLKISGTGSVTSSGLGLLVGRDDGGDGLFEVTGSSASVNVADFRVGLNGDSVDSTGVGTLSWIADASGVTSIVSTDNTEFGSEDSTLSLDLTADSNSSVNGTEYLLVNNSAAVSGTFAGLAEGATVDLGGGNSGTISYSGGTDGFDIVVTAGTGGLTGDFDNDGDVDADDIDFYAGNLGVAAIGALAQLDLNTDGQITIADHTLHVETYAQTSNGEVGAIRGDANLDGVVDVLGDAASLVNNLGATSGVGYADGDLNADGVVDVLGDASILVNNLGRSNVGEAAPATSAVPEPGSLSLLTLGWMALNVRRKRK